MADPTGSYPDDYPTTYPGSSDVSRAEGRYNGAVLFTNFEVNKAVFRPQHEEGARQLASAIRKQPFAFVDSIEGRASQTGPEPNNATLARQRAEQMRDYLLRYGVPAQQIGRIVSHGSKNPLADQPGGEVDVNRSVLIHYSMPTEVVVPAPRRPPPRPKGSKKWAIQLDLSGGAGHAGIGGSFAIGRLLDPENGIERNGYYIGGGIGVGASTPGVSMAGNWSTFETAERHDLSDFHNSTMVVSAWGVGFGLGGIAQTWVQFPDLDTPWVDVGGFNMGMIGMDMSTNRGFWRFMP